MLQITCCLLICCVNNSINCAPYNFEYALLPKYMVWHQQQGTRRNEHEETKVQAVPPSCDIKLLSSSTEENYMVFKPFWQYLRLTPLMNKFKGRKWYVNGLQHKLHSVSCTGFFAVSKVLFPDEVRKSHWVFTSKKLQFVLDPSLFLMVALFMCYLGAWAALMEALLFSLYPR